ncbi:hypothetical protein, partial [Vibrio splendidus]|uniref:hypothetical protein n=1 Tax=Vibrio splendidus TaxID=29497 RepID=UPI001A7E0CA1
PYQDGSSNLKEEGPNTTPIPPTTARSGIKTIVIKCTKFVKLISDRVHFVKSLFTPVNNKAAN